MKSGAQRKPLLVVLGILLVGAGIGLNIMLPRLLGTGNAAAAPSGAAVATVPVVITVGPVTQGTKLDPAVNIALGQMPPANVPVGAITSLDVANGQFATINLAPNLPLTGDMFVHVKTDANPVTFKPIEIPSGSVLFPVDYDAKSMAYFLVGEHIDILYANATNTAQFGITNLTIARIGNPSEQGTTGAPTTMMLVVTRAQAVEIGNLISGNAGDHIVRWLLRSPADNAG